MAKFWFVCIDVVRLRRALRGAAERAAITALERAAVSTEVGIMDAVAVPSGVRAVVRARAGDLVRAFARRFVAFAGRPDLRWRTGFRVLPLDARALPAARDLLHRMRRAEKDDDMIATSAKARAAGATRTLASLLRRIDRAVDAALGADEAAGRIRRYVGEHDAPPDDRTAFSRLCVVIFAQGIGYDAVMAKAESLHDAFDGFDPRAVAAFDADRVRALDAAPIVRNPAKISACVENARRWTAAAEAHGSYLGRVASIAAGDDAHAGWPALAGALRDDFARLGDSSARQTLKRWGFFTAIAHPGVRRCLERLGLVDRLADGAAIQRLVGAAAQRLGRDPYAVEAVLALFAGAGPCTKTPACDACSIADRCPASTASA